ncbi:MAG: PQQ-dependent dehydrogenase, methanol/ethanol family [Gammaproteobacteria bacterium]|nr:PQQ-dependent dehydrogenase, methanol/ethanol family [Gammaproteobacteria bacterium]
MGIRNFALVTTILFNAATALAADSAPPVTAERLRAGTEATSDWLMYGGSYANWRYSPLTDITHDNVAKLAPAWIFQTGVPGQFEASPLVADGVMYVTASYDHVFALDAATGDVLWHYEHQMPGDIQICCGPTNRGVALAGNRVYLGTLDAHLVALDRHSGDVVWNIKMDDYAKGYSSTAAPLVVDNKVIIGIAGGEYGARGFIDAYDVATGKRVWRRYTIPTTGEPGVETWAGDSYKTGGGPAWTTGTYDAAAHTLYWAVGNPSPDWNGDSREGDNLYTNAVLALNPDDGTVKWHFQFTPHDVWDYDGNTGVFVIDTEHAEKKVKAVVQPNRNGFLYVLDAASGKFISGSQYVDTLNWAKGLDPNGRPLFDPKFVPLSGGNPAFICPGNVGGQNGSYTAAYSPSTKLLYVPVIESCGKMEKQVAVFVNGTPYWGGGPGLMQGEDGSSYGHLSALDPATGRTVWRYKDEYPLVGGTLATAGGVVFTGNQAGYALAFDDKTGQPLWKFQTGSMIRGQPITYKLQGRQFVAVPSGGGGIAVAIIGEHPKVTKGSALVVFALPQ